MGQLNGLKLTDQLRFYQGLDSLKDDVDLRKKIK